MAFLAPLIGAAIGGIAATSIGTAVIGATLSVAMGAIASRLTASGAATSSTSSGAHLTLTADTQMPRVVIFGEAAIAGSLVYHNVYDKTRHLELVIALADHECEAMTGLWINGKAVTWHADTGAVDEFAGMTVRFYSGAWAQTADADLVANSAGEWTASDRGRGVAYVYVNMLYDQKLYASGLPEFLFRVKGAKLYDWRKDTSAGGSGTHRWGQPETYEWSDNPVVCWYNYRRGIYVNGERLAGMSTPADALPVASATAAANVCDEAVALAGGGTESRYRLSAAITVTDQHRKVIGDMVAAAGGEEVDTGGEFLFAPGIAQAPVMALTDDDLVMDTEVELVGRLSRSELINAVFGSFRDPDQLYEAIDVAPRLSAADEATDGGRFETRYDLAMVSSETQAQRLLEIFRRRARRQATVKATFRARACPLEPGDWVTWTSARYGWMAKTWEVVTPSPGADLSTELVLRETDVDVYAWDETSDQLDPNAQVDLPAGGAGLTSIAGLSIANIVVGATESSAERPGLRLTWTPIDDPSVIEIEIEVRRSGDTEALATRRAYDPTTGQYSWIDGVQGGTIYDVRARPVTVPPRAVTWSAWITPATATSAQVVEFGTPAPESVGPDQLDPQTAYELSLITALESIRGSLAEAQASAIDEAQRAAEEALRSQLAVQDVRAAVRVETIERSSETSSLAAQITSAVTTLDGHTALISETVASVDGMSARWGVVVNVDGQVVGTVQLDGSADASSFTVVTDTFLVAQPDGTGAVPVFVVDDVAGAPQVGINGDLIVDGSIQARSLSVLELSAITANLGTITAGRVQNTANTTWLDLDTGSFQFTAAA